MRDVAIAIAPEAAFAVVRTGDQRVIIDGSENVPLPAAVADQLVILPLNAHDEIRPAIKPIHARVVIEESLVNSSRDDEFSSKRCGQGATHLQARCVQPFSDGGPRHVEKSRDLIKGTAQKIEENNGAMFGC